MCQILTRISPFGMAALYEHVRLFSVPCSGGITIKRGLRIFLPVIQNLVKIRPALFHGIRTGKQGGVARQAVFQQANVGITRLLCIPVITVNPSPLSPYKTPNPALSWRYAARYPHRAGYEESVLHPDRTPSFILNICMGSRFKVDNNLSHLGRHLLAGSDIERHTLPTPVVYLEAHGNVGIRARIGIYILFFTITCLSLAGDVLSTDDILANVLIGQRMKRLVHLNDLVSETVLIELAGVPWR